LVAGSEYVSHETWKDNLMLLELAVGDAYGAGFEYVDRKSDSPASRAFP
jgi:hypothetical protein